MVSFVGGINTYLRAIIPNTNYAGLKAAVEANESIELDGEIRRPRRQRREYVRIQLPGHHPKPRLVSQTTRPSPSLTDPDYLNSAQVQAYIAAQVEAQVAARTAELDGADGNE